MECEKWLQISLTAGEKVADKKRQHPGHHQKDDDEHIGERGREIADELAPENGQDIAHRGTQAAVASGARSIEPVVISRKTSSSRPCSTRNKVTCQRCARPRSATSATMSWPSRGKISKPSPSRGVSTAATAGNRSNSARCWASAAPVAAKRTVLWRCERRASSAGVASAR